jgi:acetyl-CoA carboxylase biotin carboxylase subunit
MFRRILIANRGEIAVRVIRACREMGIESIAVYSDADAGALHTSLADRAVRIGPAAAADSYLSSDAILAAARATGAEAVHPGYGFLSEHHVFAAACASAGIVFIGPPADVIASMGSKITARQLAERAGVPVVPGETPADQGDEAIATAARRVGLPVIVKPSEGGGGIGMKTVREASQLAPAIAQARREALAAFGDGTLYVERLVERPRHVEFQILADAHGGIVHLFERECSIQRRHQKIVEETPSTALTPLLRRRMGSAAVAVARVAGYRNAGTVEFLLEGAGNTPKFYFLEMNTRLQVEHPVTEQVVSVDLVRAQIAVAAGEPLPWLQEDLIQRGHAIEVRVYAEDPAHGDLPQAGRLLLYRQPSMPGIRIDSGATEGGDIPVHYDPMIAKLIAHGETREAARHRALAALRDYPILGIRTNGSFLIELLEHPRFISGDLDTGFLDTEGASLRARLSDDPPPDALAVAASGPAEAGPHDSTAASSSEVSAGSDVGAGSNVGAGFSRPETDPWTTLRGWRG